MTLGHVTPFRVYSRASAPFFLNNHIILQPTQPTAFIMQHKVYTKLDIRQAFYKIRIDFNLKELTTFYTCYKSYKYKVL
jgi:hypothetical protein